VRAAYTTLHANIRVRNLDKPKSKRLIKGVSKPITVRPDAAQPYDDRCLSWTTAGRRKDVRCVCSADALKTLRANRKGEADLVERDGVFY
jgi:hypothetical protein